LFEIGRSWSVLDVDGLALRDRRGDVVVIPQHFELGDKQFFFFTIRTLASQSGTRKGAQPT